MPHLLRLLRLAGLLGMAVSGSACSACTAADHRQFDFWLGHWDVFLPDGSRAGENRIEAVANGCALLETWQGRSGFAGSSLNSYDSVARQWRQHWVDSQAGRLALAGGWDGQRMVLSGESADAKRPGLRLLDRIAWTPQADGSVRQLWERSEDGGKTWATVFDGRYVRVKRSARLFLRAR
ncbi:MAG TPA: hypothetical protein VD932_00160 [Aquabacterium sp.]|nr:hypothetical protein [Aquabacterium sp.]